jgi:hypothetical protein
VLYARYPGCSSLKLSLFPLNIMLFPLKLMISRQSDVRW